MAERQRQWRWELLLLEKLKPYDLLLTNLRDSFTSGEGGNIDKKPFDLKDEVKNRLLPKLKGRLYPSDENQLDGPKDIVMKNGARNEIVEGFIDKLSNELEKSTKNMLSLNSTIYPISLMSLEGLAYGVKDFLNALFQELSKWINYLSQIANEAANRYKANLSILNALDTICREDLYYYLLQGYSIGLNDTMLRGVHTSIYRYFCHQYKENQKLRVSDVDAILGTLEELSSINPTIISEICKEIEIEAPKNKGFDSTCEIMADKIPSLKGNREYMRAVNEKLLPMLVEPLQVREALTVKELEKAFEFMFGENVILEVEVFRRIVDLGYFAIPRARIYEKSEQKFINECDTLIVSDKNPTLILIEVTTRKLLNKKRRKVEDFITILKNVGVEAYKLFICEENVENEKSVIRFEEMDDKLEKELHTLLGF